MKKFIFILLLIFPLLVSAKNPNELFLRWKDVCNKNGSNMSCYIKDVIDENDETFLFASGEKKFELYDKKTGKIVKSSSSYISMEKLGEYYVAFSHVINDDETIYTTTFVLLDNELNVIKEKKIVNETRYFTEFGIEGNKVVVYDYGQNKYYIDEDLNIVFENAKSDGSYSIYLAKRFIEDSYVIYYDKNHKEIRRVTLENCNYTWNSEYVKYNNYFITRYYQSRYSEVYKFYLVDDEANLLDTVEFSASDTRYDELYIGTDGKAYTTHYDKSEKENIIVDLIEVKDGKLKFTVVNSFAEPITKDNNFDNVYLEFVEILDEEFKNDYYSFSYNERENGNYFLFLSYNNDDNKVYELRIYDSNKKLIKKINYAELNEITGIMDLFYWHESNIGFLVVKNESIYLQFYDNEMNFVHEIDTSQSAENYNNGVIYLTDSGILVKLFGIRGLPCGITSEKINMLSVKGFPEQNLSCSEYANVGYLYYEYPFNISVKTDGNGKVVSSKENSSDGEEITFEIVPNEGYDIDSVKITDYYGNVIEFTDNKFTMPAADVVIEVNFVKQQVEEENPETSDYIAMIVISILVISLFCYLGFVKKSEFLN